MSYNLSQQREREKEEVETSISSNTRSITISIVGPAWYWQIHLVGISDFLKMLCSDFMLQWRTVQTERSGGKYVRESFKFRFAIMKPFRRCHSRQIVYEN